MTVASHCTDAGAIVVLYSPDGRVIAPGSGLVLTIPCERGPDAKGTVLDNVILVGTDGCAIPVEEIKAPSGTGGTVPQHYRLSQNYPNPFNPATRIEYQLPVHTAQVRVSLKIYNVMGQEVRTLVNELQQPGYYAVTWDGRDSSGSEVATGIYFYRLAAGAFTATRRMALLK